MKTYQVAAVIHSTPENIFQQLDDFSKTGMHMSQNSMMMMGSKLKLEQLSKEATGLGAKYRWSGKLLGMCIDFSEVVTKWQPPFLKEWETFGEAKMIIMSWYCLRFGLIQNEKGTIASLSISFLPPKQFSYKIFSFLFAKIYCYWCLRNMLNSCKKLLENGYSYKIENGIL